MKKELLIGFLVGLLATSFGVFVFLEFLSKQDLATTIDYVIQGKLQGKVLALGALANFFVFFIFLKKRQIYRARGVLLESILVALVVFAFTLLSY